MAGVHVQEAYFKFLLQIYVCGDPLFPGGQYQDTILVKEGINCNSTIEAAYYAGKTMKFVDICFHCGDTEIADTEELARLHQQHGIVRPICTSCLEAGKKIITRIAKK